MKKRRTGRFAAGLLLAAALAAAGMSPPLRAFESLPDALFLTSGAQTELRFTLPGSAELEAGSEAVISSFDQSATELGNTDDAHRGRAGRGGDAHLPPAGAHTGQDRFGDGGKGAHAHSRRSVRGRGAADRGRGGRRAPRRGQVAQPCLSGGHPARRPHFERQRHARGRLGAVARSHRRGRPRPYWRWRAARRR